MKQFVEKLSSYVVDVTDKNGNKIGEKEIINYKVDYNLWRIAFIVDLLDEYRIYLDDEFLKRFLYMKEYVDSFFEGKIDGRAIIDTYITWETEPDVFDRGV